ncbi:unnamed protein product [Caenorhabditis brenneri]
MLWEATLKGFILLAIVKVLWPDFEVTVDFLQKCLILSGATLVMQGLHGMWRDRRDAAIAARVNNAN